MIDIIDIYAEKFSCLDEFLSLSKNGNHYLVEKKELISYINDKYTMHISVFFQECDDEIISDIIKNCIVWRQTKL